MCSASRNNKKLGFDDRTKKKAERQRSDLPKKSNEKKIGTVNEGVSISHKSVVLCGHGPVDGNFNTMRKRSELIAHRMMRGNSSSKVCIRLCRRTQATEGNKKRSWKWHSAAQTKINSWMSMIR